MDPQEGEAAMVMDSAGREVVSASAMVVGAGLEDVGASAVVPVGAEQKRDNETSVGMS